ncbi:MAG: Mfa1 family fimbria major subunit [Bacteroides sp.]|nr:Mfa1 family fimbria major subunit [Bacteroides sp.]
MRLRQLSVAVMAATVLVACNQETDNGPDVPTTGSEETTSLTISLSVGESNTRIDFPGNTSLDAEKRIYNAMAVAFNRDSRLEAWAEFDAFATGGVSAEQVKLEFKEISTGSHTFYVIANANTSLLTRKTELFQTGMNVSVFREKIIELGSVGEIIRESTGNGNTSSETTRGFLMTSDRPYASTITADANNDLTVKLIRAVAKVSVAYDPDPVDGELYGALTNVEYKVVNNPNQAYIFPVEDNGTVMTPFYAASYNASNYLSDSGAAHDYQEALTASTAAADATYTYCVENNNLTPLEGNSTMVKIKGVFSPYNLLDADGNSITIGTSGTFYRMRDELGIWDIEYYAEYPNNVPAGKEVVEFPNGVCYYHTWLRTSNSNLYMVKRNTYVKLTITAVNGAGEPDEGGGIDPEKPLGETADSVIKIEVLDWEEEEQSTSI